MESEKLNVSVSSNKILRRTSLIIFLLAVFIIFAAPIMLPHSLNTTTIIVVSLFIVATSLFTVDIIIRLFRKERVKVISIIFGIITCSVAILFLYFLFYLIVHYPFVQGAA